MKEEEFDETLDKGDDALPKGLENEFPSDPENIQPDEKDLPDGEVKE